MKTCVCGLPILPGCGTCIEHINEIRSKYGLAPTTVKVLQERYKTNQRKGA